MVAWRATLFLCVILFWCGCCRAQDDLRKVSARLSQADVLSSGFQGEFELLGTKEPADTPLDFRLEGLKPMGKGRLWVKSGSVLVEFLGGSELTAVGKGSPFNDIFEVLAVSDDASYHFLTIGSTNTPYANLRIYTQGMSQMETVRARIDTNILDYLNSAATINGFSVASLLTSRDCVVRVDEAKGSYSLRSEHRDAKNPSTVDYELTVKGHDVKCTSKLVAGAPAASVTIETLVEAELDHERIVPRRVAKRTSGPSAKSRHVMQFTPKDLGAVNFPITAEFFRKYQRDYVVLRGDAQESSELILGSPEKFRQPMADRLAPTSRNVTGQYSTGRIIFVVCNLVVAASLFWWYLARRSRRNA
jgi:hypothetical protein